MRLRRSGASDQAYAFACEPLFSCQGTNIKPKISRSDMSPPKSDVQLLREAGIAAFPFPFTPGQTGDHYHTNAATWLPSKGVSTGANAIPTVYLDHSCPTNLLKQGFLDSLTIIDLFGPPWELPFDLMLWAALKKKLHNLIIIDESWVDAEGQPTGLTESHLNNSKYSPDQRALLYQILKHSIQHSEYPLPAEILPGMSATVLRTRLIMSWPDHNSQLDPMVNRILAAPRRS